MKNFTAASLALVGVLCTPALGNDQIDDKQSPKPWPHRKAEGFVKIFGPDSLKPWQGLATYWSSQNCVVDGRQTKEKSKQTFLILPFIVHDFELRLKYKFVSPEGNSGIQFRSKIIDSTGYRVGGYQADFDAMGQFDGSIYDEAGVAGGRGTMSNRGEDTVWSAKNERLATRLKDQQLQKFIHHGDWNDVVLVARGNHIVYTINGHLMTDLRDNSPNALHEGLLALQLHQGFSMDVQFKDAKLKNLD